MGVGNGIRGQLPGNDSLLNLKGNGNKGEGDQSIDIE